MTHRLAINCAKNYCNRTLIVKVIVESVVTCSFWDTVYNVRIRVCYPKSMNDVHVFIAPRCLELYTPHVCMVVDVIIFYKLYSPKSVAHIGYTYTITKNS